MRLRFSIAGLMAAVLIFAVGFAGLRSATPIWASAIFTISVTLFTVAVVGAAACRGPARPAWLGFAVFGWTYLLATFWLWPVPNGVSAPPFLIKAVLDSLQPVKSGTGLTYDPGPTGEQSTDIPLMIGAMGGGGMGTGGMVRFAGRTFNLLHYRRIGHTVAAIVFGLLGALLGTFFAARKQEAREQNLSGQQQAEP